MPREFSADEISNADREALEEAYDDELLLRHAEEKSAPWYLCDILFRPRLAVVRWTREADDRLRDRAMGIMAIAWGAGCSTYYLSPSFAGRWHDFPIGTVLAMIASFFVGAMLLSIFAKTCDVFGMQLGAASNYDRLRTALSLAMIPVLVVLIPINLLKWLFFDDATASTASYESASLVGSALLVIAAFWSVAFTFFAIKAVQYFSFGTALANLVLGALAAAVVFAAIGGACYGLWYVNDKYLDFKIPLIF